MKTPLELAQAIYDLNGYGETIEARDSDRRLALIKYIQGNPDEEPESLLKIWNCLERLIGASA